MYTNIPERYRDRVVTLDAVQNGNIAFENLQKDLSDVGYSLLIIKPGFIRYFQYVLDFLNQELSDFHRRYIFGDPFVYTRDLLEAFYSHLIEKPFFESEMIPYFRDSIGFPFVLAFQDIDDDAVFSFLRDSLGATNPEDAKENSLRGSFLRILGSDIVTVGANVAHSSENKADREKEIALLMEQGVRFGL